LTWRSLTTFDVTINVINVYKKDYRLKVSLGEMCGSGEREYQVHLLSSLSNLIPTTHAASLPPWGTLPQVPQVTAHFVKQALQVSEYWKLQQSRW
jgi:hypothetical protein